MNTEEWNDGESSTSTTKGKKSVDLYFNSPVSLHNFHWNKISFTFDTNITSAVYWKVFLSFSLQDFSKKHFLFCVNKYLTRIVNKTFRQQKTLEKI